MTTLIQDLRYGLRILARNPGFTAVAVVTLALGIGANTAIFSVVNTVLLRPLPYKDADRLVMVWSYNRRRGFNTDQVSPLDFADWRAQNHVFETIAASTDITYTLTGAGEPSLIIAYSFSADYFRTLGVMPLVGRTFVPEEEQPGKNHVAVLSYPFWQSRFGANRSIIGRTITLDGAPYTVIGVMPPGFQYPPVTELWTPLTVIPEAANDRAFRYLRVIGRLKPGVTRSQAETEMNTIAHRLALEYPKTNQDDDATNIISLRLTISGDIRPALLVLMCAVGLVLLIACANVANLLLARAAAREREVAVRAALGASRSRLVRQFLTESALVGLIGGALGLLVAFWCTGVLVTMFPPTIFNISVPHLDKIPIDGWVLGFALAVSVLTGVIFGLVPALQAGGLDLNQSLKEAGRSLAGSTRSHRFRGTLVVSEVALSLVLLAAAGLALRSFVYLLGGDLGFNPQNVLTLRVMLPDFRYKQNLTDAQRRAFSDQAIERLKALPGVKAAGGVTFLPLSGWWGERSLSLEGQPIPKNERPIAAWSSVTPDYFRAMAIPLLEGRYFTDHDTQNSVPAAIISKSLARRLAPNQDPLGKRLDVDGVEHPVEVVGVVGDVHQLGITSDITSEIYFPFSQLTAPLICFALRTSSDPTSLAKSAERAIWDVDKDQSVGYSMSLEQLASESLAPERVVMLLLGAFAGVALILAAVGLYGVISYAAAQRTHEIGIRMALGAEVPDVLKLVVVQGLKLTGLGLVIGLAASLALTRLMASLLYGVRPTDSLTFSGAVLLLAAVATLASYIPARRATKVDPMVALRHE
ncbi:MAG TPA: ABC transporter permease [Terriglobia bacterium]|nr:ABC transporter permease [Terriglobia bacterium]